MAEQFPSPLHNLTREGCRHDAAPPALPTLSLFEGFGRSALDYYELWLAQCALTGTAGPAEVEAYVVGALIPTPFEHDVIAQALNERLIDLGLPFAVAYADEGEYPF